MVLNLDVAGQCEDEADRHHEEAEEGLPPRAVHRQVRAVLPQAPPVELGEALHRIRPMFASRGTSECALRARGRSSRSCRRVWTTLATLTPSLATVRLRWLHWSDHEIYSH